MKKLIIIFLICCSVNAQMTDYIYGRGSTYPNTFIGGIGTTVNTPALLAAKLGILPNRIRSFSVIGSNIQCAIIGGTYEIPQFTFLNDATITYYNDPTGLITLIRRESFANSTITDFRSPSAKIPSTAYGVFRNCIDLVYCDIRSSEYLGEALNDGAFQNCTNPSIVANLTSAKFIPGYYTFKNSGFSELIMPSLEGITYIMGTQTFFGMTNCNLIDMKKLKILLPVDSNSVENFNGLKLNCTIRVNQALLTDNSGLPNAQLVWVKANRMATVEFYDDAGNYVISL